LNPVFKAEEVNKPHRAFTLAGQNQRVLNCFLIAPAKTTIFLLIVLKIRPCLNENGLLELLPVDLI
jgi:hypothetical protein